MSATLTTPEAEAIHDVTRRFKTKPGAEHLIDRPLARIIEEIEDFQDQIDQIKAQVNAVYARAKDIGFDATAVRAVVRERKSSLSLTLPSLGEHYKRAVAERASSGKVRPGRAGGNTQPCPA